MPQFDPELIQVMKKVLEDIMTRVPLEHSTPAPRASGKQLQTNQRDGPTGTREPVSVRKVLDVRPGSSLFGD